MKSPRQVMVPELVALPVEDPVVVAVGSVEGKAPLTSALGPLGETVETEDLTSRSARITREMHTKMGDKDVKRRSKTRIHGSTSITMLRDLNTTTRLRSLLRPRSPL